MNGCSVTSFSSTSNITPQPRPNSYEAVSNASSQNTRGVSDPSKIVPALMSCGTNPQQFAGSVGVNETNSSD